MSSTTADEIQAEHEDITAESPRPDDEPPRKASDGSLLRRLAIGLVGAAAGFYLLQALGDFLRPILIAVLLCYAIWPLHARLKQFMNPGLSLLIIGVGLAICTYVIGRMVFANASEVWAQMPTYQERAARHFEQVRSYVGRFVPAFGHSSRSPSPSQLIHFPTERIGEYLSGAFGVFAGFIARSVIVGLYVVFILEEAPRFPRSIRRAFPPERSARILEVAHSINEAVIEYISVKVKANLVVAVPATLLMLGFGVQGAVLWGVLTFFARFIPYLGGIVAFAVPTTVAALQFESPVRAIIFAVLLLAIHFLGEYVVEPIMTGKAVGLSPLVVLLALAFWELAWGVVGMALAIPLTVIFKIALERLPTTRPVARLLADED